MADETPSVEGTGGKKIKLQQLTPYKKVCVIENGIITKMYWEHPTGNDPFDHDEVITRWNQLYGKGNDYTDQRFLSEHGFTRQNVIRDGVRMTT